MFLLGIYELPIVSARAIPILIELFNRNLGIVDKLGS